MGRIQKLYGGLTLALTVVAGVWARPSFAVSYHTALTSGVMQQPTSSYYHLVYGGHMDVGADDGRFVVRASYFERPVFRSVGYIDKDYGWSGLMGRKLAGQKGHQFFAFFGGGKVAGYIKPAARSTDGVLKDRSFALPSFTAAMEYRWTGKSLFLGAGHQTLIGFADQAQTEAFVAWPFSLFTFSWGVGW